MPELGLLIQMGAVVLVIGAFAGVLAGLLGVGGGIVLVPAYFYAFSALGYGGPQLMQMFPWATLAVNAGTVGADTVGVEHGRPNPVCRSTTR